MKCCEVKVSDLEHEIVIQTPTEVRDDVGGFTVSWATLATVWAKITPMSANQIAFSQQLEHRITHKILIRYRSDLSIKLRISFDGRIFQVKGFRDLEEAKRFIEVTAEEGSPS